MIATRSAIRRAPAGTRILLLLVALCAASASLAADAAAGIPRRIASINLCADALLLTLVPRDRLVSVSGYAVDPARSPVAARARGLPLNFARMDTVLLQRPDLVVATRFNRPGTLALLRKLGVPLLVLGVPDSVAQTRAQIRRLAAAVGARERGEAVVREMNRRLARVAQQQAQAGEAGRPPVAAVYGDNGYTAGSDTLVDDLLRRAGFANLAAREGVHGFGSLPLEDLVLAHPDLLVFDARGDAPVLASRILHHPALRDLARDTPVIYIPPRLWVCAGPWMVDAVERLAAVRDSLTAARR